MSSQQITLTWLDSSGDASTFKIMRAFSNSGPFAGSAGPGAFTLLASVPGNTLSYTDNSLQPSTSYYYEIIASNSAGDSIATSNIEVTTTSAPVSVPSPASNLLATAAAATIVNLSWSDNSSNETGFKIERSANGGTTFTQISVATANATTYQDINLLPGTSYVYRVRATNSAGDSTYTANSNVTTLAAANKTTYAYIATNIVGPNCVSCHQAGFASGGTALDTYAGVSGLAKGGTLVSVISPPSKMPPGSPLSADQILSIQTWVNAGSPNN